MLPLITNANRAGLGLLILNPNANTMEMAAKIDAAEAEKMAVLAALMDADMTGVEENKAPKVTLPIAGSETPEAHLAHVWRHYISKSRAFKDRGGGVHFLGSGRGGEAVVRSISAGRFNDTPANSPDGHTASTSRGASSRAGGEPHKCIGRIALVDSSHDITTFNIRSRSSLGNIAEAVRTE
jgi:hypothetical protein